MRIDLYLHRVRLAKSRTLAQSLIEQGTARIDGRRAGKASETVRIGSVIAMSLHGRVRVIRVLGLPSRRGPPAEARTFYEEIDEASAAT